MLVHILYLPGIYVGHSVFDRGGQVDYRLSVGGGLPYVEHGVYHFQSVFGFGTRE